MEITKEQQIEQYEKALDRLRNEQNTTIFLFWISLAIAALVPGMYFSWGPQFLSDAKFPMILAANVLLVMIYYTRNQDDKLRAVAKVLESLTGEKTDQYSPWPARSVYIGVVLVLLGMAAVPTYFAVTKRVNEQKLAEAEARISKLSREYGADVQKEMEGVLADMPYVREIHTSVRIAYTKIDNHFKMNTVGSVRLFAEEAFDDLPDDEQYEYLCELEDRGRQVLNESDSETKQEVDRLRATLRQLIEKDLDLSFLWSDTNVEFHVVTVKNNYQYVDYAENYFLLNGEGHDTAKRRAEKRKAAATPTPTAAPKTGTGSGAGSSKSTNPYKSYDEGYDDIMLDGDYDWDRYWRDPEYANGVDDAMEDEDW